MTIALQVRDRFTLDGQEYALDEDVLGDGLLKRIASVPPAKTGQLTTRTDNDTGVLTMAGGHGIQQGDRLDVYWGTSGGRRGLEVTAVDANLVSIDGGAGDNLPDNLTSITAAVPVEEEFLCSGDNVLALLLWGDQAGTIVVADADDADLYARRVASTSNVGRAYLWYAGRNPTNPLDSADLAKAFFSHRSSTATAIMRLAVLFA